MNKKLKKRSSKPEWFCIDCGDNVKDEGKQWHSDVGHRVIPRDQVRIEGDKKQKEKDERTASKKCQDFALSKIKKMVISENNSDEVYALVEINSHIETINLESKRAKQWLNNEYSKHMESNEIHADDFYKTVLNSIVAKAQMNGTERTRIYNRIAQLENEIYYDLGTHDWQAIKITKEGIKITKLGIDSPIFKRTQTTAQQVEPNKESDNALDQLVDLLHISQRQTLVQNTSCCSIFRGIPNTHDDF